MATQRAVHPDSAGAPLHLVDVDTAQLITPAPRLTGHPSGGARDVEETMQFALLSGVRAGVQQRPLEDTAHAYAMAEDRARRRVVLTM